MEPQNAALERDELCVNEIEGRRTDNEPEEDAHEQRAPANRDQSDARDAAADQEQRGHQADAPGHEKRMREAGSSRRVGVDQGGQTEQQNEPGKLQAGSVVLNGRGGQGDRDNPKSAGQLHGGANEQSFRTVAGGGANDRTGIVDGQRRPKAELRLRQMQERAEGRKDQERNGVQHEDGAQRYGHFFRIGLQYGTD